MNLGELRDEVKLIAQDGSFTDAQVDAWINQVVADVCAQCMLRSLKRMGTVATSTTLSYVSVASLTGGFSGRLIKVLNGDGVSVGIMPSVELLMWEYGAMDAAGSVESCCLEGTTLWYAKIPATSETLTLLYFCNPEELVSDDDVPSDIPVFVHRQLIVNGAAAIGYDLIEGGEVDEGNRLNARVYAGLAQDGMRKLQEWLGRNKKHYISSLWSA